MTARQARLLQQLEYLKRGHNLIGRVFVLQAKR